MSFRNHDSQNAHKGQELTAITTPEALRTLVTMFERNIESHLNVNYIEEHARREFIDHFFDREILGWDVANREGHAEAYKDVLHGTGIKTMGGGTGAPDYTFRIGGTRMFFAEAKKPSARIEEDREAAYQLRRYAWSAKLPLSILTSFNELAVYDCRVKPHKDDKASTARILYKTYRDYISCWSEIAGIFAKEAVLQGSFDRFAQKEKRGTAQVDDAFLEEIEMWRDILARNIALRNPKLNVDELNFVVQRTIDRIIFLRLCEDRGTEPYGQLKNLCEKTSIYQRLHQVFLNADQKYNSGLFHFSHERGRNELEDTLTPKVKVDDGILREIISNLYYPLSPYEFSVLGVDILGNVYEQFLGKVIRLTEAHHAKVEEKPEVKKAGGVYYTPPEIVEYIVTNTIGQFCKDKTPSQIEGLRILDPACGSGSFLIGAYTWLLNYHRDWYVNNGVTKYPNEIYQGPDKQFYLTTQKKKSILRKNIFGVDKDSQAVEVTKLNLLMKVLEGETHDSLERQQKLVRERALPDLGSNIKCGNSLISPDFHSQAKLFDLKHKQLNPFDWENEFSSIMSEGRFHVVIGNPPYLSIENIPEDQREYFESSGNYHTAKKRFDAFGLFVERSLNILLAPKGLFGMIVPSVILSNKSFTLLRRMLLESTSMQTIVNLGSKIFRHVNNDTLIMIFTKQSAPTLPTKVLNLPRQTRLSTTSVHAIGVVNLHTARPPNYTFEIFVTEDVGLVLSKIARNTEPLNDTCNMFQGLVTGNNDAYVVNEQEVAAEKLELPIIKPVVFGSDIPRYGRPRANRLVIYLDGSSELSEYPRVSARLAPYKPLLLRKREVKLKRQAWWVLHWPRDSTNFERKPKIFVQCLRNPLLKRRIVATLDNDGLYADQNLTIMYPRTRSNNYDLRYVLAILNSKLINFYFTKKYVGNVNIKEDYLKQIPIRTIDFKSPKDQDAYQEIVRLVDAMLQVTSQIEDARVPDEKTRLTREHDAIDKQIDQLIYTLYDLSESEIALIEAMS